MEPFQNCTDTSDVTEISLPQQLFLKPEAKLNVTVALPQVRLPGKTISNWEVMERLKQMIQPDEFMVLRVSKSTLEFIRFDAEIENRTQLSNVITRLEGKSIKLSGFPELLKIKAAESKPDFPTRHDWDKYFRDAKNMNEMKPGERPDTIHIENLPSKWFISKKDKRNGIETPNEFTLQKVFEIFGEIRYVDIPMLDPYRNQMKASISGIKKFSHLTDSTFDAYIQYKEYICFVKAMNALRGMKLVHREGNKAYSASIKVDFDKTKHLSDMSIRRRKVEREKLMAKEREREEEKRREEEAIRIAMEEENRKKVEEKELKGKRQKEREEKRKQKILKKLKKKEAEQMNIKIAIEERKLLMAQRKLESIRLLDELFERVKQEKQRQEDREKGLDAEEKSDKSKTKNSDYYKKKHGKDKKKKDKWIDKEKELRKKLVKKIKTAQEQQMEERREKLMKTIEGKNKLKSGLRSKDDDEDEEFDLYRQADFDYDVFSEYSGHDSFRRAYGFSDWGLRGVRGFIPRRSYRSCRGGFSHYQDWVPYQEHLDDRKIYETNEEKKKSEKGTADGMEDITSDSSSGSSSYSHLDSSENGDRDSKNEKMIGHFSGEWALYEGRPKGEMDLVGTHPWVGYSDFYNPRFFRSRGPRRPRGGFLPRRGWGRGFPAQPNPNVPMNSFYMQSINSQYYKYFNKLAKGDYNDHEYRSRSRSRSHSSERVVCRKVLSRSRSRSRKYSRSKSKSRSRSRTRSSSRSRKRSRSRSRSRSKGSDRNHSRSRSQSRRKRSDSKRSKSRYRSRTKTKSRSKSKEKKQEEIEETKPNSEAEKPLRDDSEKKVESEDKKTNSKEKNLEKEKKSKEKDKDKETKKETKSEEKKVENSSKAKSEESDWSLSLSGSDGWSRGSPERKARPLGDPNWVPDRRDRDNDRAYRTLMSKVTGTFRSESYMGYDRLRDRYKHTGYRVPEEREPNLRSHISRPKETTEMYHSNANMKDSKKSRHKRDKKRKRKYHEKSSSSKKKKTSRSDSE